MGSEGLLVERPAPGQNFLAVWFRDPLPRWETAVCGCPEEEEDSLQKNSVAHGQGFLCVLGRPENPVGVLDDLRNCGRVSR